MYLVPVDVFTGLMSRRLDGEDSYHPRGFPLYAIGQTKGYLITNFNFESMNKTEDFRDGVIETLLL